MSLGFELLDAAYMSTLALTTVGFTSDVELTSGARLFTMSIAVLGVILTLALVAVVTSTITEGRIGHTSRRKRMDNRIAQLRDHFIVAAYGRVGRAVTREFEAEGAPFVVIDRDEELSDQLLRDGVQYLIGDPTSEDVLRSAGVERARGLISAVDSDADNVFITLTARSINPELFIIARASEPQTAERLYKAGANRVVSPYVSSGQQMALLGLRPRVVDYLEIFGRGDSRVRLDEIIVEEGSPLVGRSLKEACGEAIPVLLRRSVGDILPNPDNAERLREGDLIILVGEPGSLRPVEG
jgi:voltage-gated potassium channel